MKVSEIRNRVITGSFTIGEDGMKEPVSALGMSDWEFYAKRLEEMLAKGMFESLQLAVVSDTITKTIRRAITLIKTTAYDHHYDLAAEVIRELELLLQSLQPAAVSEGEKCKECKFWIDGCFKDTDSADCFQYSMFQSLNQKGEGWISVEDVGPFAEWRNENRWFNFNDGKWRYTFDHGTATSKKSYEKNYTKTTEELYQMYKDSLPPKPEGGKEDEFGPVDLTNIEPDKVLHPQPISENIESSLWRCFGFKSGGIPNEEAKSQIQEFMNWYNDQPKPQPISDERIKELSLKWKKENDYTHGADANVWSFEEGAKAALTELGKG